MKVSHPDQATTLLRVRIEQSRTEAGIDAALDELLAKAKHFPKALGKGNDGDVPPFLVVTFHGDGHWVSERRFFERAARFPDLRPKIAAYVDAVNPKLWASDPFHGRGFWTSLEAPAGSLAIVPLALADVTHVETAIRHLRGVDLDHETFQRSFIAKLVEKHGVRPETLRLLAFRAVDGSGQNGNSDLRFHASGLLKDYLDGFAEIVDRESRRDAKTGYRALYVSNAGKAIFAGNPAGFEKWIAHFEKKKLKFDDAQRKPGGPRDPYPPKPWKQTWEEAASCTERDD